MAHTIAPSKTVQQPGDLGALITLSADGAGTVTSPNHENFGNASGVVIGINITAITGTSPTLTVSVYGIDGASGQRYLLLASAAKTATGFSTLTLFPGAPTTANVSANAGLPAKWEVEAVIGGTGPAVTATIGASLLK